MDEARRPPLHIALMHPEIPGNTGNIGRLCVGVGAPLHLIKPLGFDIDEKAVRRAGLDYWRHVQLHVHEDEAAFREWLAGRPVIGFSAKADQPLLSVDYPEGVVLLFGRETKGLPAEWRERVPCVTLPQPGPVRSLNLSNAAAVATYFALSKIRPGWFA